MASGVRRIEATVGKLSLETMNRNQELLFQAAQVLKTTPGELAGQGRAAGAGDEAAAPARWRSSRREASLGEARQFLMSAKDVGGLKVLTATRSGMDANELRQMGDFLRDKEPGVVACWPPSTARRSPSWPCAARRPWPRASRPATWSRPSAAICGGKGGGKPDSAMGGGSELLKLDDALAAVDDFVAGKLGL